MTLLKSFTTTNQTIAEDAAGGSTGAGSIASNFSMPLFSTLLSRTVPTKPRLIKYSNEQSKAFKKPKKKNKGLGIRESFYRISEDLTGTNSNQSSDTANIISKLKSLEDQESVDYRDTTTFGLVDNKGEIIRVTLPKDQSEGFEQDIQRFLSDRDESEQAPEIAEILFKMKDRYTFVNVEWPQVEEDAEESQELTDGGEADGMAGDELVDAPTDAPTDDIGGDIGNQDTGKVEDLLGQVIDMMRADADARKAEAHAREAEAKTKQADSARQQAMARVKQEEQFLDMDEYNKNQKNKEKEAKRLAQLSKWKHDVDSDENARPAQEPQYDFVPGEEDEELFGRRPIRQTPQHPNKGSTVRGRVNPSDVAKFIMDRSKSL